MDTKSTQKMLQKIIDEAKPDRFIFSGGEPFMRADLRDLINLVHQNKLPMNIISNGALLEEDDFDFCKKNGVDTFEFTLLSDKREVHNALARPYGDFSAFDNVLWATKEALKHHFSVIHVFVATKKNIKTLKETMALSYALGVRTFLFNRFNAGGEGAKHIDELQLSPVELAAGLNVANDFVQTHPTFDVSCAVNIPPCLIDLKQFSNVKMTGCGVGENQRLYVLDPVDNIRLCNFSSVVERYL